MNKYLVLLVMVLLTAAIMLGCTGGKVYGKEDTDISVNAGDTFTVKLDENPTTGYQWSYTISDENIVEISQDEYVADTHSGEMTGAGGVRSFTFIAKAKGNAVITMVYERSWEKSEDDEKISFQIDVK